MSKNTKIYVKGSPVTTLSIPADGISYVTAQIVTSGPAAPNNTPFVVNTPPIRINKISGTLNASGVGEVIIGPMRERGTVAVVFDIQASGWPNASLQVSFT